MKQSTKAPQLFHVILYNNNVTILRHFTTRP